MSRVLGGVSEEWGVESVSGVQSISDPEGGVTAVRKHAAHQQQCNSDSGGGVGVRVVVISTVKNLKLTNYTLTAVIPPPPSPTQAAKLHC